MYTSLNPHPTILINIFHVIIADRILGLRKIINSNTKSMNNTPTNDYSDSLISKSSSIDILHWARGESNSVIN